jgi:hypothetical protein
LDGILMSTCTRMKSIRTIYSFSAFRRRRRASSASLMHGRPIGDLLISHRNRCTGWPKYSYYYWRYLQCYFQ